MFIAVWTILYGLQINGEVKIHGYYVHALGFTYSKKNARGKWWLFQMEISEKNIVIIAIFFSSFLSLVIIFKTCSCHFHLIVSNCFNIFVLSYSELLFPYETQINTACLIVLISIEHFYNWIYYTLFALFSCRIYWDVT